jgi:hypothetical protein
LDSIVALYKSALHVETVAMLVLGAMCLPLLLVPSLLRYPQNYWRWISFVIAGVSIACSCLMYGWSGDSSNWIHAIDYRRVAIVAIMPFLVCAAITMIFPARGEAVSGLFSCTVAFSCLVLATSFLISLVGQGSDWARLRERLRVELRDGKGVVDAREEFQWAYMTPLRTWSLPYNSMLLQGTEPHAVTDFRTVIVAGSKLKFGSGHELRLVPEKQGAIGFGGLRRNVEESGRGAESATPPR